MNFILSISVFFFRIALVLSFFTTMLIGQSLPGDISSLSDSQVMQYWQQAKSKGYTLEQIKTLAVTKGVSAEQIAELESRITSLNNGATGLEGQQINNSLGVSNATPIGYTNNVGVIEGPKSPIYGSDFFNNPNISFTPNINVATPEMYQLGPGDQLVINIWGAAENTYSVGVDREGVLRLPNVGPVFVNGMDIAAARGVILNKLKRIYGGINASENSPYKVFVDISLSEVRSIQVNIIGEITVPGTYTLSSLSSVLNALYASGGPTAKGTFREIKVIRNGAQPVYFDIYKYLLYGSQEGNITLRDNDLIIVSPYLSRITVKGAVKRQGQYELKSNENFNDLIKFVSGFNANAYKNQLSLKRIENDRLVLKEIDFSNFLNEELYNGDVIEVSQIIEEIENSVSIIGTVYRPGTYEFKEGLTLKKLIEKSSGITQSAFLERGLIYRGDRYTARTSIPFSLKEVLDGTINIELQNKDQIRLFDKNFMNFKGALTLSGGVREPGTFDFYENLTIEDAILMAGGLTDKANPKIIDVYRKINDDSFETLAESFKISLDGSLNFSGTSDFELQPGDRISVRLLRGINDSVKVEIIGEVNYPGNYSGSTKGERISDFIKKAGGLSDYAFKDGATLIRQNPFYDGEAQDLTSEIINEGDESISRLKNRREFRVGIDLVKIMEGDKGNMVLKDGDRLIIPSIKETVKVEGEVLVPSLIREENHLGFKDYINKSGGFNNDAVKRKSYVIYPNGEIASTKNFLFFKSYPKVKPGSIVIVPAKKVNPNPISAQEVLGLTSGFATLALLVDRLLSN